MSNKNNFEDNVSSPDFKGHCERLFSRCGDSKSDLLNSDVSIELARARGFSNSLTHWLDALEGRPEQFLITTAAREYELAVASLVLGLNRQAFAALRLSLELTLHLVHLSAHDLWLRQWINGDRDSSWGMCVNDEKGVFSEDFVGAYCPMLEDERKRYQSVAESAYRACSEFVHGTTKTKVRIPKDITFDRDVVESWINIADSVRQAASYALSIRYLTSLKDEKRSIKAARAAESELSHLESVRDLVAEIES